VLLNIKFFPYKYTWVPWISIDTKTSTHIMDTRKIWVSMWHIF